MEESSDHTVHILDSTCMSEVAEEQVIQTVKGSLASKCMARPLTSF